MTAQLDLFTDSETELLRFEIEELRKAQANMRRGLFARFGELSKLVLSQQLEIETLKESKMLGTVIDQLEVEAIFSQTLSC